MSTTNAVAVYTTKKLSPGEQKILEVLSSCAGEVVTRTHIEHNFYGEAPRPQSPKSNVIEVLVSRLRRKLMQGYTLQAIRGVGYKFDGNFFPQTQEL